MQLIPIFFYNYTGHMPLQCKIQYYPE